MTLNNLNFKFLYLYILKIKSVRKIYNLNIIAYVLRNIIYISLFQVIHEGGRKRVMISEKAHFWASVVININ